MKRIVGNIAGYHGLKGDIKIFPLLDDPNNFLEFNSLHINSKSYQPVSIRFHKNFVLASLKEIDTLEKAEKLTGYVMAEFDDNLADNEYYISDLIEMRVFDQNNLEIGKVTNYSKLGQKLVFIKLFDNFQAKGELLVPFVEEYIISVSPIEKKLQINLTNELLELCL
jgi:16S rRNA processing protein RimM